MAQPKKRDLWKLAMECETLAQVHEALGKVMPAPDAGPASWRTFYRHSAKAYARIAEVDRGHHHEALYWASRERANGEAIKGESSTSDAD